MMSRTLLLIILVLFYSISPAQAHKLLVAAGLEKEGVLKIEAFFPDGSPAREVPVSIMPEGARAPFSGRTDDQGTFRFYSLPPGNYRIVAGDSLGHQGETKVVIPGDSELTKTDPLPPTKVLTPPPPAANNGSAESAPYRKEPIPWVAIVAGLGFIFGLTSLLMLINRRQKVRRRARRRASRN